VALVFLAATVSRVNALGKRLAQAIQRQKQ
jgi:hypothetical protein